MGKHLTYGLPGEKTSGATNKTRIIIGLSLIFSIVLFFSHTATQQIAKLFNYHPALGRPILHDFYLPWEWVNWYLRLSPNAIIPTNEIIKDNFTYAATIVIVLAMLSLFMKARPKDQSKGSTLQGSARFANKKDIKHMHLTDSKGVFIGSYYNGKKRIVLQHDGPEHILLAASTGSGKGVSVIVPTLLTLPGSIVCYDLKGENWALSSKWRKLYANNNVIRFEPASNDGTAASYNPLIEIRLNTEYDVLDVQNIAAIILDYDPSAKSKGDNSYFDQAGYSLLIAYILHSSYIALNRGEIPSLPAVVDTLTDPNLDQKSLLTEMSTATHRTNPDIPNCGTTHDLVLRETTGLIQMLASGAGRQFQGIQGHIQAKMSLFLDPIVRKNIVRSDFRIRDLMHHDKPTSLFIIVGSTDKARLGPLTKLLFTQIIRNLTTAVEIKTNEKGENSPSYKHKLLMLIDEFPTLGKMPIMNEAIAFLRGFGIRCLLVIQDYGQLESEEAYGRSESISANSGIEIVFTPSHPATAKRISEKIGKVTVASPSISLPQGGGMKGGGGSTSIGTTGRELLTADELLRMGRIHQIKSWYSKKTKTIPGDSVIFITGFPPIWGKQLLFFQDPVLNARSKLGALETSDKIPLPFKELSPGVKEQIDIFNSPDAIEARAENENLKTIDFSREPDEDDPE